MTIEALRTPEDRFSMLPGYPYKPHYVEDLEGYEGLRMAYIDEGSRGSATFLCLHGEPTWGYLYRKMMPVFLAAGHRVVVPDLFGFGRSDKPVADGVFTFDFHRNSLMRLIERLDLRNITLVCQDWGGILGLTLPMDYEDRFDNLLVMNTAVPTGQPISEGFAAWKEYAAKVPDMPAAGLIASDTRALSMYEIYPYDAPFPDARYKAGPRRFPQLVPVEPGMAGAEHGERARRFLRERWSGKSFMAIGMRDPVLGEPVMRELRTTIRGCPEPMLVEQAAHFVQEFGEPIAQQALAHFGLD